MRASAPLLLPGRPRAADAVPSASTSCRRTVRVRPSWPTRTASRIPAPGSWPNVKASALWIALAAAEALWPLLSCPFSQHELKPLNGTKLRYLHRLTDKHYGIDADLVNANLFCFRHRTQFALGFCLAHCCCKQNIGRRIQRRLGGILQHTDNKADRHDLHR